MNNILWLLKWILKAAIFFTLFAFALNNQQDTTVYFFFGNQWQAPQVLVVLTAFAAGVTVGVLGMLPWWWKQRLKAQSATAAAMHGGSPAPVSPVAAPVYTDGI